MRCLLFNLLFLREGKRKIVSSSIDTNEVWQLIWPNYVELIIRIDNMCSSRLRYLLDISWTVNWISMRYPVKIFRDILNPALDISWISYGYLSASWVAVFLGSPKFHQCFYHTKTQGVHIIWDEGPSKVKFWQIHEWIWSFYPIDRFRGSSVLKMRQYAFLRKTSL